jgi:hypothetical protein
MEKYNIYACVLTGYTRHSGLMIALKTSRHEFLHALFHRSDDPLLEQQKHFITAQSLNIFHQENVGTSTGYF